MDVKKKKTLLFLNRIRFLNPREKCYLYRENYSLDEMLHWQEEQWRCILGRRFRGFDLRSSVLRDAIERDLYWEQMQRGWICSIEDDDYPELLKQISDPPIILYGVGNRSEMGQSGISVVGTRSPDYFGRWAACSLGANIARSKMQVVSGLAYGIDIAAHLGALQQHGVCAVVLGTSIDTIYPRKHRPIAAQILKEGGIILSEIPPNMSVAKYNFIGRNRIISGLTMHTVVVQAPEHSGALSTAAFALEQNRNLAVHRVGIQERFMGTYRLWRDGAECVSFSTEW